MTLVAAFRCQKGGILLCADREESYGPTKREVDKIYRMRDLVTCEVFIADSGPGNIIRLATEEIHASFIKAKAAGEDALIEHRGIVEQGLGVIYEKFPEMLLEDPMNLVIVVAPRESPTHPLLYHTDGWAMIPESFYIAHGSGKAISDYLADRLYVPYMHGQLDKGMVGLLAAFILREAERSVVGVGMGANMVFINEGESAFSFVGPENFKGDSYFFVFDVGFDFGERSEPPPVRV
jgi:20S proteasome alpha/beta subunit